jgi:hypothetical protein
MSDPDRRFDKQGAEPPLTMDRRRGPRARGPAPVTLIVSVLLLVVVAGGVFYMYRSGARSASDAPQPLGAPLGDLRAPAPPQAQARDASDGLTISKDDPNAPPPLQTLAPAPEQPLPESAPPAAAVAPPLPPGAAKTPPVLARQAPPPRDNDKSDAIDRLITNADRSKASAKLVDGPALVQIGAFSSQSLADEEWSKAAAVAPGAMAGKGKRVIALTKDGETLYRTSITGFASREQAQSLCDRLRAAGGSCFVH